MRGGYSGDTIHKENYMRYCATCSCSAQMDSMDWKCAEKKDVQLHSMIVFACKITVLDPLQLCNSNHPWPSWAGQLVKKWTIDRDYDMSSAGGNAMKHSGWEAGLHGCMI